MKIAALAVALVGTLAVALPVVATSASAAVVRKTVTYHGGPYHGCKMVRTVKRGPGGRRVVVRKICH